MMTMKKAYYALLLTTATFAQLNAFKIPLLPAQTVDNIAVEAISGLNILSDLSRLITFSSNNKENPYKVDSTFAKFTESEYLPMFAHKKELRLLGDTPEALNYMARFIVGEIVVAAISTCVATNGIDALDNLFYNKNYGWKSLLSILPPSVQPVVRGLARFIGKETVIIIARSVYEKVCSPTKKSGN